MDSFDLDSLVHLEQTFYDAGFKDGFDHGRIHGLIEGRALGREKGFEMWEELGFYEGFAKTWIQILQKQGRATDRAYTHASHLMESISQFPRANPSPSSVEASEMDIPKLFRQIRSRYKALCSSVGVKPSLRSNDPDSTPSTNRDDSSSQNQKVWRLEPSPQEQMSF
ncbi:DUF1715-domain-containing protein [Flagelloscypha sp. PMI_526]|nr:DUF1715-domain-containing protein [Flagelloscypha sp. PMI_526]